MYDPAHARSRTVQPMGGNLKPDLTLKTCLVYTDEHRKTILVVLVKHRTAPWWWFLR